MITLFSSILVSIGMAFVDALHDFLRIKRNEQIDHTKDFWQKTAFILGTAVVLAIIYKNLVASFSLVIMYPFTRWIFFDLMLNRMRRLPWDYIGQSGPNRALTDEFLDMWDTFFRTRGYNVHHIWLKIALFLNAAITTTLINLI